MPCGPTDRTGAGSLFPGISPITAFGQQISPLQECSHVTRQLKKKKKKLTGRETRKFTLSAVGMQKGKFGVFEPPRRCKIPSEIPTRGRNFLPQANIVQATFSLARRLSCTNYVPLPIMATPLRIFPATAIACCSICSQWGEEHPWSHYFLSTSLGRLAGVLV